MEKNSRKRQKSVLSSDEDDDLSDYIYDDEEKTDESSVEAYTEDQKVCVKKHIFIDIFCPRW